MKRHSGKTNFTIQYGKPEYQDIGLSIRLKMKI
jgi:hypothetical protein